MQKMKEELLGEGHEIHFVAVNGVSADSDADRKSLTDRAAFPMLQDVPEVDAWAQHGGGKDDMFIYDDTGLLRRALHIKTEGFFNMDLSTEEGYAFVKAAILQVVGSGSE